MIRSKTINNMFKKMKEFVKIVVTGRRDGGSSEVRNMVAEVQEQSRIVTKQAIKLNSKIERTQTYFILKAMGVIRT